MKLKKKVDIAILTHKYGFGAFVGSTDKINQDVQEYVQDNWSEEMTYPIEESEDPEWDYFSESEKESIEYLRDFQIEIDLTWEEICTAIENDGHVIINHTPQDLENEGIKESELTAAILDLYRKNWRSPKALESIRVRLIVSDQE